MSTIIKNKRGKDPYTLLSKGAPEIMKKLFKSNLPKNYDQKLMEYSEQGFRVLALGFKSVTNINQKAAALETQMSFLGFLLLDNPLKKISAEVIDKL